jgi:hypothetical protein
MTSDIIKYDNFLNLEDFKKIQDKLSEPNWYYGHGSYRPGQSGRKNVFWCMSLQKDDYFTEYLLNIIEETTQEEYILHDVYANGHTFGTMGDFHVDWNDITGRTFLYYANANWKPEWCGKTMFNVNGNIQYFDPKPNSALFFPGCIPHCAEATSKLFTDLRVTIAWKLQLK